MKKEVGQMIEVVNEEFDLLSAQIEGNNDLIYKAKK